ncbi:MAG: class I SAM-dependent methyltransferase [Actinomycetota bacterium]
MSKHLHSDERFDLDLLRGAVRYQRWLLSTLGPIRGEVLEIGAGSGNFTRWLAPTADRLVAVEPDPELAQRVIALGFDNVEVLTSRLETMPPERTFDTAVMINVLEHIEDDTAALVAMRDRLKPGGRAVVVVPAHQVLYGRLDEKYHHFRRYSKRGVADVFDRAGFALDSVRYFNPLGAIGWLVLVRWMASERLAPSSIWVTENIVVPLGKGLDALRFRSFGQSVVALGRRPA